MKILMNYLILIIAILTLTACSENAAAGAADSVASDSPILAATTPKADSATSTQERAATPEVEYDPADLASAAGSAVGATIQLNGTSITVEGDGATADGSTLTINAAGTYEISGTLTDGQIIVDSADAENVTLILAGVNLTSQSSASIYVANAEKVILTLAAGTENVVTDGASYANLDESGEPNAAIFSKDDLTINGEGALTVNANYNNGIASKDDLKITGGTLTVNAVNDGVKGKDSVAIKDGVITINAQADGIQATSADEAEKGYVAIEGGTLNITAGLDGVQAETSLLVSGGTLNIFTGGGSVTSTSGGMGGRGMEGNHNQTDESMKGLKAGLDLTITGGAINISALDDALHSNGMLTLEGGDLQIASGDDGVHADTALTINGGMLDITASYEGLESLAITINNGTIHLVASDDGINASDGSGNMTGGFGGGSGSVAIHGGYLYVDAGGDGLDSNGTMEMSGGVVLVNGPTNNGNGPTDFASFDITGGFLVAVGSSGMAQAPSDTSTQYAVLQNLSAMQSAGTLIHLENAAGENILTFVPAKEYQSVLISSPDLQNGESYVLYTGGSASGTVVDGLVTDGDYTPGMQAASFTISRIITGSGGMMGGPGGGLRPPGSGQHP